MPSLAPYYMLHCMSRYRCSRRYQKVLNRHARVVTDFSTLELSQLSRLFESLKGMSCHRSLSHYIQTTFTTGNSNRESYHGLSLSVTTLKLISYHKSLGPRPTTSKSQPSTNIKNSLCRPASNPHRFPLSCHFNTL